MLAIDLAGKRALVAGVADDRGFGFAIAKALAQAGAQVCVSTWPPAMEVFRTLLARGKMDASLLMPDGNRLVFERMYPLDAEFDSNDDIPESLRQSRRYRELGDVSITGLSSRLVEDFGENCLDVVVHSIANGPEVNRPLLQTSRKGYQAAVSVSAYSFVSLVQRLGPLVRRGGSFLTLTYLGGERVVAGYGGGMSSAKAALESDVRVLAYEAGRQWGVRINAISAGPWASRAASTIGMMGHLIEHTRLHAPLPEKITADEVATTAAFLASSLASGITGTVVYVDKGYHVMGMEILPQG